MQSRLKDLQRVALVYMAVQHAQALELEQAAAALREAESLIEERRVQAKRSSVAGRAALEAGDHVDWQMHESQKQFTAWNTEGLIGLRERREAMMTAATESYRAGRMQLKQMESVLRDLRLKLDVERARVAQRESDERFLSRQWWNARSGPGMDADGEDTDGRMKSG